jgi:hypothetical protein
MTKTKRPSEKRLNKKIPKKKANLLRPNEKALVKNGQMKKA